MNLMNLRLIKAIRNHDMIDAKDLATWNARIPLYKYPIGAFPKQVIQNNHQYLDRSYKVNLNYFKRLLSEIYSNFYTSDELDIICTYLMLITTNEYSVESSMLPWVTPYIEIHSEKPEIEFCLEEIKYYYLYMLLDVNTAAANQSFETIYNELLLIEDQHNHFIWEEIYEAG